MENKNNLALVILGIITLSVLGVMYSFTQNNLSNRNTISVSGSSAMDVIPDQAILYLRVEYNDPDPKLAQDGLTAQSNKVINALKKNGLSDKDIETVNYNLELHREWGKNEVLVAAYRASHTLKLTINDLSKVGSLINLAVDNGANNVDSLQFVLSRDKEKEVKSSLLSLATQDTRAKADLLAESLNSRVKGIISVSESSGYNSPFYYAEVAALKSSADAPVIQPKSVSTTVSVNAVFEIA